MKGRVSTKRWPIPDARNREIKLAQSLKETYADYLGRDLSQWPERQQEFRHIAAKVQRGELWTDDDWACFRCETMNLTADPFCRKCGMNKLAEQHQPIALTPTTSVS